MIQGKETDNLCVSRRSAAFEACKQLHEIGALSDNLMPFNKRKCIDTYRDVYFNSWSDPRFTDGLFKKKNIFSNKILRKTKIFLNSQIKSIQLVLARTLVCMM